MKLQTGITIGASAVLVVSLTLAVAGFKQRSTAQEDGSQFVAPATGALIEERLDFAYAVSIPDFDESTATGFHYWISLGLGAEPGMHWPKTYVSPGRFEGRVSDGGSNPLPVPQEMTLLLLQVDDATNQDYVNWLREGMNTGSYPGRPLRPEQVAAEVLIRFP